MVQHPVTQAEDHPLKSLDEQARRLLVARPERSTSATSSIGISLLPLAALPATALRSVTMVIPQRAARWFQDLREPREEQNASVSGRDAN